ncbi:MAG TPA: hypothetical protein VKO42_00820 [Patescibacteria group bacterium]|nr:hypothetical protein [Patescibacteria group bacterium]
MKNLPKQVGKDWRESYIQAECFPKETWEINLTDLRNGIVVSPCSKEKSFCSSGIPKELYKGKTLLRLFSYAKETEIRYGVLSDKYGLVLDDEVVENYDTPPSGKDSKKLITLINKKIERIRPFTLFIYSPRPMQTWHWVRLLAEVPIKHKKYIRTLPKINRGPYLLYE